MNGLAVDVFRKTWARDSKCKSTGGKRHLGPMREGGKGPTEETELRLLCTFSPSPTPGGEGANAESGDKVAGERE